MIYLVHVGCHLVTTCLLRHWINGRGCDQRMNIGEHGRYGHISAYRCQHVPGTNMCWAPTCQAPICTRRQHVPGANMSGANLRGPFQRGSNVPGANMSSANLTPFFSKNTPKLPFLAAKAQMKFFNFFGALSTVGSCPRLLEEHVQKNSQNLTSQIVR
jgi:hypothetical protein